MVLSRDEFPAKVKAELKEALAYFIERQKLVAQAIPFLKTKKPPNTACTQLVILDGEKEME